jgi:PAS domain S-box-containing protein
MPSWPGYLLSGLLIALAATVRWALPETLGPTPYLTFYPAVVAAAGFCGRGPGLLATISSLLLVDLCFDRTPGYIDIYDAGVFGRAAIFLAGGVGVSVFAGMQRALHDRERRQSLELREKEQRLRANFDNAALGIVEVDCDDRVVAANQHFCEILGHRCDDLLGRSISELTAPEDRTRSDRLNAELHQGIWDHLDYEKRYLKSDGSPVWVHVTVSSVRDGQGQFIHSIGTVEDISRRKAAEEELRESEELRRVALQAARMGTWDFDPTTGAIDYDLRTQLIFGVESPPDTYRKFIEDYVHPDDTARVDAAVRHALEPESDGAYSAEYRILWPDRSIHWVQAHGQTIFEGNDSDRRAARMVGTVQDITNQKQIEEFLTAARQSAERAKSDAEQANRAKDHFLAVLSHELRTPLTPVVMGVSLLQDRVGLDAELRETLEMVRRNVEMEARLIDDLLDATRIERGKIELSRTPVELCTVIQRAVEVCKPDIEARQLHFGVDVGPDVSYWIDADVPRLQQVFWNLLKNAVKFTPRGGCVGIRCRRNELCVVVEVNDSGIGIEPEAMPRIFNAFEQADISITRQFGGLGLGLAISKALVEMHGGEISVHSNGRNRGATFRVRLPLAAPASRAAEPPRLAPASRAARPLHILLVEDHGATAAIMQKALAADGHTVDRAGDVATALRLADRGGIDLLVSDLGLPDGSGHDLMQQLRRRGHRFPGIALSGYGQDEDIRRSRQAGFAAHLTKPASRELVMETIAAVLRGEMWSMIDSAPISLTHDTLVFDAQSAIKKCWGDRELFVQMVQCFMDDDQSLLPRIAVAARRTDLAELAKLAHRFKGTIVHLGAELAREAVASVERLALDGGDAAEVGEAVKWLERECEVLKQALSEYKAVSPSDAQRMSHADQGV